MVLSNAPRCKAFSRHARISDMSDKPIRIQLKRTKGWRLPPNTVSVARPTRWGNPWRVGEDGDAQECVDRYRAAVRTGWAAIALELRGKNLACWCPLPKPGEPDVCHAAVLLEIANA